MTELEHADSIKALVRQGKVKEAIDRHNRYLRQQLDKAEAGHRINLSDLMAAKEILDQDILRRS
jgi:hypothetical protein